MKTKLFLLCLVLASVVTRAQAQTQTLEVWGHDITMTADGTTVTHLTISERDVVDYTGFSLTIVVPKGIHVAQVRSGRDYDKFAECKLHAEPASQVGCPLLAESPVNLECQVTQVIPLGSHDLFLAKVVAVDVDEALLDESGKLRLDKADLIVYSHGEYFDLGKKLGTFGYSVRKKKTVSRSVSSKKVKNNTQ